MILNPKNSFQIWIFNPLNQIRQQSENVHYLQTQQTPNPDAHDSLPLPPVENMLKSPSFVTSHDK